LTFDLRPGCKEGTKITFEKEGDQAYGYEPQDIIFQLTFKKHKDFDFDKSNLHYTKEITLIQALKSNISFTIDSLDKKKLKVYVTDVISPTYEKVMKGEGLPKTNGERGDLIVKFDIKFPTKLSDEQKSELQKILL